MIFSYFCIKYMITNLKHITKDFVCQQNEIKVRIKPDLFTGRQCHHSWTCGTGVNKNKGDNCIRNSIWWNCFLRNHPQMLMTHHLWKFATKPFCVREEWTLVTHNLGHTDGRRLMVNGNAICLPLLGGGD